MKLLFWRCVKAYNLADFEEAITEMEDVNAVAVDAFRKCGPHLFCRSFVKLYGKCDVILSNMVDPKKPGKLSRHGVQMTCGICNKVGHNKRKCPEKGKAIEQPPPLKRSRGRPKKYC